MTASIVAPELWHAEELAERMRGPDRDEVWAAAHQTPQQAVLTSLAASDYAGAVLLENRVACMFGVASNSALSLVGAPWLLATDELEGGARSLLRESRRVVTKMRRRYEVLRNYADARNERAVEWIRWLGFEVLPAEPFGAEQLPFHPFEMAD